MNVGTFKMNLICEACMELDPELADEVPHTVIPGQGEEVDTFICQGICRTYRPLHIYVEDGLAREEEDPAVLFQMCQTDGLTITHGWPKEEP